MSEHNRDAFIESYYEFKNSVDFTQTGFIPDLENLVWCMLMGVPEVPADSDSSEEGSLIAIDQRATILKAVFIEVNIGQSEEFLDTGLQRYDQANRMAKRILEQGDSEVFKKSMDIEL